MRFNKRSSFSNIAEVEEYLRTPGDMLGVDHYTGEKLSKNWEAFAPHLTNFKCSEVVLLASSKLGLVIFKAIGELGVYFVVAQPEGNSFKFLMRDGKILASGESGYITPVSSPSMLDQKTHPILLSCAAEIDRIISEADAE